MSAKPNRKEDALTLTLSQRERELWKQLLIRRTGAGLKPAPTSLAVAGRPNFIS